MFLFLCSTSNFSGEVKQKYFFTFFSFGDLWGKLSPLFFSRFVAFSGRHNFSSSSFCRCRKNQKS